MVESLIQIDGVSVPTSFVNARTLTARIPSRVSSRADPPYVSADGPAQQPGVIADRVVPVAVYTPLAEAGTSNRVFLRIRAKWVAQDP
jgi:hypothetical protein